MRFRNGKQMIAVIINTIFTFIANNYSDFLLKNIRNLYFL